MKNKDIVQNVSSPVRNETERLLRVGSLDAVPALVDLLEDQIARCAGWRWLRLMTSDRLIPFPCWRHC
jgi:hypothetical protein